MVVNRNKPSAFFISVFDGSIDDWPDDDDGCDGDTILSSTVFGLFGDVGGDDDDDATDDARN